MTRRLTEQASPVGIHREEATMATETPPRAADLGDARGDSGSSRPRWRIPVAALVGGVLLVLLAIVAWPDGGKPAAKPKPDPTAEKQAIVEAVQGFHRVAAAINRPPDPADPELRVYATGRAYDEVLTATQKNQREGITVRSPANSQARYEPEVVSTDGDNAIVRECSVDDGVVYEMATGRVINDAVVTRLSTIFLAREGGRWKVTTAQTDQRWEGVAGCAL